MSNTKSVASIFGGVIAAAVICVHGAYADSSGEFRTKAEKPLFVGVTDTFIGKYNQTPNYYVRALERVGHIPFIIPRTADTNTLRRILDRADAVVISGGGPTVSTSLCSPNHKRNPKKPLLSRDEFDSFILRYAAKRRMPVLGICRGNQVMNVAFGGSIGRSAKLARPPAEGEKAIPHRLYPYMGSETNPPTHTVSIVPGTKLARLIGTNELSVNSHHTWSAKRLADGFRPTAFAPDGVVEAIENPDLPFIGVQFHPEAPVANDRKDDFDIPRLEQFFIRIGDFDSL